MVKFCVGLSFFCASNRDCVSTGSDGVSNAARSSSASFFFLAVDLSEMLSFGETVWIGESVTNAALSIWFATLFLSVSKTGILLELVSGETVSFFEGFTLLEV